MAGNRRMLFPAPAGSARGGLDGFCRSFEHEHQRGDNANTEMNPIGYQP